MKITRHINQGIESLISLLYESKCSGCKSNLSFGQKFFCINCQIHLPISQNSNPASIMWGRVPIKYGFVLLNFEKGNICQNILHQIKYNDKKQLAKFMGKRMGKAILEESWESVPDIVIPIPLHPKKLNSRGYNQAGLIAEGISEVLNIPNNEKIIKRIRANITQTKKNKFERWGNVEQVFKLADSNSIKNKHILLIDDAITTGATLESCIRTLIQVESCTVSIACLAIAK